MKNTTLMRVDPQLKDITEQMAKRLRISKVMATRRISEMVRYEKKDDEKEDKGAPPKMFKF